MLSLSARTLTSPDLSKKTKKKKNFFFTDFPADPGRRGGGTEGRGYKYFVYVSVDSTAERGWVF